MYDELDYGYGYDELDEVETSEFIDSLVGDFDADIDNYQ